MIKVWYKHHKFHKDVWGTEIQFSINTLLNQCSCCMHRCVACLSFWQNTSVPAGFQKDKSIPPFLAKYVFYGENVSISFRPIRMWKNRASGYQNEAIQYISCLSFGYMYLYQVGSAVVRGGSSVTIAPLDFRKFFWTNQI